MMLTTNDKLRRKPNEFGNNFNPALINHNISSFNSNDLFYTSRPAHYLSSMYLGKSLAEELQTSNDEQKKFVESKRNEETIEVDQSFLHIMGTNHFYY